MPRRPAVRLSCRLGSLQPAPVQAHAGEARSGQVAARLLDAAGVDHLVTVDLHAPGLESAFRVPVTHVEPSGIFLSRIRLWQPERLTVVSPDAGALQRAQHLAMTLEVELAAIAKARPEVDQPKPLQVLGDVGGRTCLLVDDIASTGTTLTRAAEALLEAGADSVHAAFTHPVMAAGAMERLIDSPIGRLATTDSIPPPEHERIEVVPLASTLTEAIRDLSPG